MKVFFFASSIFLTQTESELSFEKCRRIQIDKNRQNFHLLFLEDDVCRKWIKIDKSRRVLCVLRSNVSAAKRKHDKMQSQNGIRIPTYVACGFGRKPIKHSCVITLAQYIQDQGQDSLLSIFPFQGWNTLGVFFLTIDVPIEVSGVCLNITNQVIHIQIVLFSYISLDFSP